jgi:chromosome segregation ATPase
MPKLFRRYQRQGKEQINPLSFYQLSRAFIVDRDFSYSSILSEMPATDIRDVMQVLLGITTKEIADAENKQRELMSERNKIENQIDAINTFLRELDVPSLIEIENSQQRLLKLIDELEKNESVIRNDIKSKTIQTSETFEDLRQELLSIRGDLAELDRERINLQRQIKIKTELRNVLQSEANKLYRHMASKHVISTYTFSHCPRCLQEISETMMEREIHGNCMLCGREFSRYDAESKGWEKSLRDTNQLIKEADELIESYQSRLNEVSVNIRQLHQRMEIIQKDLNQETENFVSPLIEEISLNRANRISIEKSLSELDYEEKQRTYANELRDQRLPQAEKELERIEAEIKNLRVASVARNEAIDAFLHHFRYFIGKVGLIHPFESITWDKKNYLPLIGGQV